MNLRFTILAAGLMCSGVGLAQTSVPCGRATNIYTILRPSQNQVYADQASKSIIFIHRQDVSQSGEPATNSGVLLYSVSDNFGSSFTQNVSRLNPAYTRAARYPQIALYNGNDGVSFNNTSTIWSAPTLKPGNAGWDGHVGGALASVTNNPNSTENYGFQNQNSGLPGGLSQRPGTTEYFMVETPLKNDTLQADSIYVYKGIFDPSATDIAWSRTHVLTANTNKTYDGVGRQMQPNLAFSPDGQTAWIGALGDLVGGNDSVYSPILYKSTDGGQTWGAAVEVQLTSLPIIMDSLQSLLYLTQNGDTAYVSAPTATFDFDITVDNGGNPHFFCTVGAGEVRSLQGVAQGNGKVYSVYPFYTPMMIDITSLDGGNTWTAEYISPLLTFRTDIPVNVSIDAYPQTSRNADGSLVFFSWTDTDTLLVGSTIDNTSPNLRVAGLRISDRFKTCFRRIEGVINDDLVLAPSMSPYVISDNNNTRHTLPIVSARLISDSDNPVEFHYLGNVARLCNEDFVDPNLGIDYRYSFDGICYNWQWDVCEPSSSIENEEEGQLDVNLYPNPVVQTATVDLSSFNGQPVSAQVFNNLGQMVLDLGEVTGSSLILNAQNFNSGIYMLTLRSANKNESVRFLIQQ